MDDKRNDKKLLTGKAVRMDREEMGINARNWVDSTQDRDF
jgi:hypothetical protein